SIIKINRYTIVKTGKEASRFFNLASEPLALPMTTLRKENQMFNRHFKRAVTPIAAALILCLTVGAQVAPVEKVDMEMMKKIREEGLERSQVMDTLSWLTDVIGYRLTGSPNMKAANEWTKERLAKYGLVNSHVEPWGTFGRGWSFDKVSIHVTEPTPFPVIGYPKAWTPGTNGPVVGEVIFANI